MTDFPTSTKEALLEDGKQESREAFLKRRGSNHAANFVHAVKGKAEVSYLKRTVSDLKDHVLKRKKPSKVRTLVGTCSLCALYFVRCKRNRACSPLRASPLR